MASVTSASTRPHTRSSRPTPKSSPKIRSSLKARAVAVSAAVLTTILAPQAASAVDSLPPVSCNVELQPNGQFDIRWDHSAPAAMFRYVFYRDTNATHHRGFVDAGSAGYNAQLHTDTGVNTSVSKYRMKGKTSANSSASGFVDCTWVKASVSGLQIRPLTETEIIQNGGEQNDPGAAELSWTAPVTTPAGFLITGTRRNYATDSQIQEIRRITISDGTATNAIVGNLDEFYWDWTVEILNNTRPTTAPNPTPLPMLETPTIDALFNNHDTTATLQWDNDPEAAGHNTFIGSTFHKYYPAGPDTITIPDSTSGLTLNLNGSTEIGVVATAYGNLISARASDTVDATNDFAAPTNVTASRTGENTVDISWNPVPGAGTTYTITRRTSFEQGPAAITEVATGLSQPTTSVTDNSVTQGVSTWEITAVSASGVTATSNPVHAVGAPTITSIVSNNDGTATITWDEAPNTTGLNLFLNGVYTPPFINGNNANTTTTNSTTITIADGSYTVTLQAGAGSNNILGATSAAFNILGTPTNLAKANTSNSADIIFNWDPVTGATGYVLRITPPGGASVDYPSTSTSVTVNDLTPTTPGFTATVTAHNAANDESSASTPVSFATRPATVTNATLTQTAGGLHLTWDAVPGAAGYDIRRIEPDTTNTYIDWFNQNLGTSFTETPGTQGVYTYEVRATGNGLKGVNYAPTNAINYDTAAPTPPTAINISSVTETGFDAAWAASTDGAGTGVSHYLLVTKDTQQTIVDTQTVTAPTTTATITGLAASTAYTLEVTAVDNQTNTSTTTTQTLTTTTPVDTQRPSTPTGLVLTAPTSDEVVLDWADGVDNVAVTGYIIYRGPDTVLTNATQLPTQPSVSEYVDTDVAPNTEYTYFLKAFDAAGNVSWVSGPKTVTTPVEVIQPPTTPTPPTGTSTGDLTITLNWALVANTTSYEIYRDLSTTVAEDPAQRPPPVAVLTDPTNTWTDPGPANGFEHDSIHTYRIVAVNDGGQSTISAVSNLINIQDNERPSPPQSFDVSPDANGDALNVSWVASTDNVGVTGYNIHDFANNNLVATVGAVTTWDLAGLAAGNHTLYVKAFDAAGNTSWRSGTKTLTVADNGVITDLNAAKPIGLLVQQTNGEDTNLTWAHPQDQTGVIGYNIYNDANNSIVGTVRNGVNATTWTLSGLNNGVTTLYVKSVDSVGTTSYRSNTQTVTTNGPATPEKYMTAEISGRWEIVQTAAPTIPVIWEAVNVRTDKLPSTGGGAANSIWS